MSLTGHDNDCSLLIIHVPPNKWPYECVQTCHALHLVIIRVEIFKNTFWREGGAHVRPVGRTHFIQIIINNYVYATIRRLKPFALYGSPAPCPRTLRRRSTGTEGGSTLASDLNDQPWRVVLSEMVKMTWTTSQILILYVIIYTYRSSRQLFPWRSGFFFLFFFVEKCDFLRRWAVRNIGDNCWLFPRINDTLSRGHNMTFHSSSRKYKHAYMWPLHRYTKCRRRPMRNPHRHVAASNSCAFTRVIFCLSHLYAN